MEGRTTFVTSHRYSLVRKADQILVFDAGKIVERGSHDQLMQRGGMYSEMYTMQMGHQGVV